MDQAVRSEVRLRKADDGAQRRSPRWILSGNLWRRFGENALRLDGHKRSQGAFHSARRRDGAIARELIARVCSSMTTVAMQNLASSALPKSSSRWGLVVLLVGFTFIGHFNRIAISVAGTGKIISPEG